MIGARKVAVFLMLAATLATGTAAAQLGGRKPPPDKKEVDLFRELEMLERDPRPRNSEERAAAKRRELFKKQLSDFAGAWNRLMQALAKGGWNARQAKTVRIAFDRLVHSDGWAEGGAKDDRQPDGPQQKDANHSLQ